MSENEESSPQYITVARVMRPQGRRGEVAAEILTDFPERLTKLESVYLNDGRSAARIMSVRGCWLSQSRGGQAIFHFQGSDSISDAEKLVGLVVQIPISERMPLPDGSYYVNDLIGCEVRDLDGRAIGRVRDVQFTGEDIPGTPLLVIDAPEGELLIPLAQQICVRVDLNAHAIDVKLPDGLRDLNR
ncbi:MAG: ribosome maturation factor RimM [Candidatus Acidiferrales bacterium]